MPSQFHPYGFVGEVLAPGLVEDYRQRSADNKRRRKGARAGRKDDRRNYNMRKKKARRGARQKRLETKETGKTDRTRLRTESGTTFQHAAGEAGLGFQDTHKDLAGGLSDWMGGDSQPTIGLEHDVQVGKIAGMEPDTVLMVGGGVALLLFLLSMSGGK